MARESRLTLEIEARALPLLPQAEELAPSFQAGGLKANRRQFEPAVEYAGPSDEAISALLYDPQTSGGLLLLVPAGAVAALQADLPDARRIGRALPPGKRRSSCLARALVFDWPRGGRVNLPRFSGGPAPGITRGRPRTLSTPRPSKR